MSSPSPKVIHIRHSTPEQREGAVYVGRPSKWSNPYIIGRNGGRDLVIDRFKHWLLHSENPKAVELREALHELRGKNLMCWCAPDRCHADVLLELANA